LIIALIKRRIWLWKNRFISSIAMAFLFPILVILLIIVPLKSIILYSVTGILYESWVYPGFIFLITSIGIFPLLYRDFFDLRIHQKLLANIALTPYSKSTIIFSYLIYSIIEAIFFGFIAAIIYSLFIPTNLSFLNYFIMLFLIIVHLLLLGNLFITMSLLINSISIMWIAIFCLFVFVTLGNGFIIEFEFFPQIMESILRYQPFSYSYQSFHMFMSINIIDWKLIIISLVLIYFWILFNGFFLRRKFQQ
tara:strand:- start:2602 stop:3351 length:750 start_codon:yes stop_codon:yes gene_type:complete